MKFWDREKEKEWLKRFLMSEPNSILFVYGPKSSGKSTLLAKVIEELPQDEFKIFWYDLRGKVISDYSSVLKIFFREKNWIEKGLSYLSKLMKFKVFFFELEGEELEKVIRKEYDAFEVMENILSKGKEEGKKQVIVFDELQKLKEVYMNSPNNQRGLINELFNFFVRLTKVLHLAHVIVMTSDTFFIERVYTDSTLKNTSRYYLVDFFDEKTAIEILKNEGIEEEKAKEIVEKVGGVPWILSEIVKSEEIEEVINDIFKQSKARIRDILLNYENKNKIMKVLEDIIEGKFELQKGNMKETEILVEKEILYYDPINEEIRFQTKLDKKAAKELLNSFKQ